MLYIEHTVSFNKMGVRDKDDGTLYLLFSVVSDLIKLPRLVLNPIYSPRSPCMFDPPASDYFLSRQSLYHQTQLKCDSDF